MNKALTINLLVMVLLSLVAVFLSQPFLVNLGNEAAANTEYTIGRATAFVLVPFVLIAIPSWLYKIMRKKSLPGFYVVLWFLWVGAGAMALYGSAIEAVQMR